MKGWIGDLIDPTIPLGAWMAAAEGRARWRGAISASRLRGDASWSGILARSARPGNPLSRFTRAVRGAR